MEDRSETLEEMCDEADSESTREILGYPVVKESRTTEQKEE